MVANYLVVDDTIPLLSTSSPSPTYVPTSIPRANTCTEPCARYCHHTTTKAQDAKSYTCSQRSSLSINKCYRRPASRTRPTFQGLLAHILSLRNEQRIRVWTPSETAQSIHDSNTQSTALNTFQTLYINVKLCHAGKSDK